MTSTLNSQSIKIGRWSEPKHSKQPLTKLVSLGLMNHLNIRGDIRSFPAIHPSRVPKLMIIKPFSTCYPSKLHGIPEGWVYAEVSKHDISASIRQSNYAEPGRCCFSLLGLTVYVAMEILSCPSFHALTHRRLRIYPTEASGSYNEVRGISSFT